MKWFASLAPALLFLAPDQAFAVAEPGSKSALEVTFLIQIVLLLSAGRLLGEVMQRIGQPSVMGQLIAGLLLGPSVFGAVWPEAQRLVFPVAHEQKAMLDAVSQLGILLLLLLTGMETDLGLVKKVRRAALSVSVAGVAVPFACGFALGEFLPETMLPKPELRLITSLFLGTALSISSVKIVAMVVREMGFLRRNVGQVIVASAIIDDTIGWVIIAITFSLALHGSIDPWAVGQSLLGTALFLGLSFTLGRRVVFLLIRWANDELESEAAVITTILVVMGLMALATQAIGVHTVLGAFVAGILVGQSPILTRHIDEQLRGLINALFAPVFFGLAGLSADLTILKDPTLLMLTVGLVAIASLGKFAGAFLGGSLGGLRMPESLALACGMNARGSTEVIVATIGLSIGALSQNLFTMIVAMAVLTTLAMPPMLRWALRRLPLDDAERTRLEREELEERGFVPNLERLLVAADESPKGRFAARLAGLLAGRYGMPVTVIQVAPGQAAHPTPTSTSGELGAAVQGAADAARAQAAHEDTDVLTADVTEQRADAPIDQVVAAEAEKGFDLLVIGIEPTVSLDGGFNADVARAAEGFAGPLAIVAARGTHLAKPERAPLDILVPVNGTNVSRRGAEVALNLARAAGASVTALFVASANASTTRQQRFRRFRRSDEAVLKEIVELADQHGTPIRIVERTNLAAEDAILREARMGDHNLIVMGASRRPGESLAFGNIADAVLEASERSVLLVST
ncbi:cation:proton antiporter domain-containing protein [Methylobacterium oxalidis]|uniref:cation:proton antiporter domain-containing protein n=1 Tax=Methylobacterium oxalidis TaxID=944322 RepID=UPI003314778D